MLERVLIKNYRCLREVHVPLRPLTVLVGENDSGKSSFLSALRHIANGEDGRRLPAERRWRLDPASTPVLRGALAAGTGGLGQLRPSSAFMLPSAGVSMTSQGYGDIGAPNPLGEDGGMVPALLDHLLRRDRKRFFAVIDALRERIPGLEDVEIGTPDSHVRRVDLVIENGLRIPADQASAGVRLLIFFVALAYHPDPPKLILIEEPEHGLHPRRLGDVISMLRELTEGKHAGHRAQVVLTTHSPYLLDAVDVERDQVLVFRRNEDGSRSAEPVDQERMRGFLDEFMLGEIWFNQREEGMVGLSA